jgi:hypothetical protein
MCVNGGVSGGSCKVLVLSVRNVKMSLRVTIFFGETKVNNVNLVSPFSNAHQKVIRLDISVNKRLGMDVLDARNLMHTLAIGRQIFNGKIIPTGQPTGGRSSR